MVGDGWSGLFASAFQQSRNAMILADGERRIIDANGAFVQLLGRPRHALMGQRLHTLISGGPLVSDREWKEALAQGRFVGEAPMLHADGSTVSVQWAASVEVVTGRRLVLFVAVTTSRSGAYFRRSVSDGGGTLTTRERDVVHLVALGQTGPEIAGELGIAHDTVRSHVRKAMDKLGARSRAHLVAKALAEDHL